MESNNGRYRNRNIIFNQDNELYQEMFTKRGTSGIYQYNTANYDFSKIKESNLKFKEVYWKNGDRLYKLSYQFYNDVDYWWAIAFFNQKPTDSDFKIGDLVLIPYPLQDFLDLIGA